jgi:hypothetical protein
VCEDYSLLFTFFFCPITEFIRQNNSKEKADIKTDFLLVLSLRIIFRKELASDFAVVGTGHPGGQQSIAGLIGRLASLKSWGD